jgi:hypothetical protein
MTTPSQPDGRALLGHLDAIDAGRIQGWAWAPQQPAARLSVDIHHHGEFVAAATADRFRQDLLDNGIEDGHHAFVWEVPAELRDADPAGFAVYFAGTRRLLSRGGAAPPLPADLGHRLDRVEANIDHLVRVVTALHLDIYGPPETADPPGPRPAALLTAVQSAEARLDGCEKSMQEAEGFLLRFEKQLAERAQHEALDQLKRQIARKAGWPGLIGGLVVVVAVDVVLRLL